MYGVGSTAAAAGAGATLTAVNRGQSAGVLRRAYGDVTAARPRSSGTRSPVVIARTPNPVYVGADPHAPSYPLLLGPVHPHSLNPVHITTPTTTFHWGANVSPWTPVHVPSTATPLAYSFSATRTPTMRVDVTPPTTPRFVGVRVAEKL